MSWRRRRRMKKVKPGDGSDLALYRPWQVFSRSLFHIDLPDEDGSATSGESMPSGPARGGDHPARGGDHSGLKESASATSGIRHTYAVDVHFFADDVTDYSLEGMWDGVGEAVGSLLGSSGKVDSTASIEEGEGLLPKKLPRPPVALYRDGKQTHRSNLPVTFRVPDGVIDVEMSSFGLRRIHYVRDDGETFVLQPDAHSAEGLRARFGRRFPGLSRVIGAIAIAILLVGLVVAVPQLIELVTGWEVVAQRVGTFTSPINLPGWANTTLFIAGVVAAIERALTLRNHWLIDMETTWWSFG